MLDETYVRQAELLLRCLPEIGKQSCYALKGGTAINLFHRQFPRLSVDIDLTYLPICSRPADLREITESLSAIASDIEQNIRGSSADVLNGKKVVVTNGQRVPTTLQGAFWSPVRKSAAVIRSSMA